MHNLLGAVTIAWVVVVGTTGVINTWADLVIKAWQNGQLVEMVGPFRDRARPEALASVDQAVATARLKVPSMIPFFVAYPGSMFSSQSHYIVFMRGDKPLTARLLTPVMIDALDGSFTDSRSLPWFVSAVLLSQPLHFGDYGGLPLKIVWALMDIAAIAILFSGLYRMDGAAGNTVAKMTRNSDFWRIYRTPAALAAISSIGLVAALVGDGLLDMIGWGLLVTPLVVAAGYLFKFRRPPTSS